MPKIKVKVVTNARENSVFEQDGEFVVRTTAVPEKGKANEKIFRLLANYLNIPKSQIRIIRGKTTSHKIIEF